MHLLNIGKITCIMSEDSDFITLGAEKILYKTNFFKKTCSIVTKITL